MYKSQIIFNLRVCFTSFATTVEMDSSGNGLTYMYVVLNLDTM